MLIIGADKPWYEIVLLVVTALCGIYIISAGMEGYMYKHMPWWERILALGGGLCMVIPGLATDIVGLAIIVLLFILQKVGVKKNQVKTA